MGKLIAKYNVLNLPDLDYEPAESRNETILLVKESRKLHDDGYSIEKIAEKIDRSHNRTKELITGVNKIANSDVYKKISGL